jgi:hypothetical protein
LDGVGTLIDAAAELLGDGEQLGKLHRSVVLPFAPLVEKELLAQRVRFDKLVKQSIQNEDWRPLNEDSSVSGSAVDIFTMIGQALPMMLGSGLLLDDKIAKSFIRNIDSCIMSYALHCSGAIGEAPAVVMDAGWEAENAIDFTDMCIQMNSLDFAKEKVADFSGQLTLAMGQFPDDVEPDSRPFAGSLDIVSSCREKALRFVSGKIICCDMAETLLHGLYAPTPAGARIDQVLANLDELMGDLLELGLRI